MGASSAQVVDGVLLVYHHPPVENAPTILEHVRSFTRHSQLPVLTVNTDRGFPRALAHTRFAAIVLHYSLFGGASYALGPQYLRLLEAAKDSTIVAFFQDEHQYCPIRARFIDTYGVDVVYTLLEPRFHDVYSRHESVRSVRTTLTGYVTDELVNRASALVRPDEERAIDVGYRARKLPYSTGRGGQEKHEIAEQFLAHARGMDLRLDVAVGEQHRIYGDAWYEFVASCRGMLGAEAGTTIFDLDGSARRRTEELLAKEPDLDFETVEERLLHEYEGNLQYRTVSPRHFEAAALRVAQIMYRGEYSGVLEPDIHYLALEKDFSNFDAVMARFLDPCARAQMTGRAYDDLIASGRWSDSTFVATFDEHLRELGVEGAVPEDVLRATARGLQRFAALGRVRRHPRWFLVNLAHSCLPGGRAARRTLAFALREG